MVPFKCVTLAVTVLEVAVRLPEKGSADSVDAEESVADVRTGGDMKVVFCPGASEVLEDGITLDRVTVLESSGFVELGVSEDDDCKVGDPDRV